MIFKFGEHREAPARGWVTVRAVEYDACADLVTAPEDRKRLSREIYADPGGALGYAGVVPAKLAIPHWCVNAKQANDRPLLSFGKVQDCTVGRAEPDTCWGVVLAGFFYLREG